LQFTGQNTNGLAGAFPGFDAIEAGPPLTRNQLYQLQTNLTDIPTPGIPPLTTDHRTSFPNALAITLRLTVLF
jgi:hypothetical protein